MLALRYSIIKLIGEYKSARWKAFIEKLGKNPLSSTPVWKRINRMRQKNSSSGSIGTLIKDSKEITSDQGKAEIFADKLTKTFNENKIDHFDEVYKKQVEEELNNYLKENSNTAKKYFKMDELQHAIKKLNNKTSMDKFGHSNLLIKNISEKMKGKILMIFNNILEEGKIPKEWKSSVINMISKKST